MLHNLLTGIEIGIGILVALAVFSFLPNDKAKKNTEQMDELNRNHKRKANALENIAYTLDRIANAKRDQK